MKLYSLVVMTLFLLAACGGGEQSQKDQKGRMSQMGQMRQMGQMGQSGNGSSGEKSMAVPVEITLVKRDRIAQHFETNGVLEAENEVDLVARTNGPIVELLAEEGDRVRKGQLLARIDEREAQNQVTIAGVSRNEAQLALNRSLKSYESGLISQELHDATLSKLQSAQAQLEAAELQLTYTEIRAPFDALVIVRNVKNAEYVSNGATLFRVSDFGLLLCPVEIPERELSSLAVGQGARIEVDAFRDQVFSARVLRIRPTVDPETGTVTVTLKVEGQNRLRPGMFASVFLEVAAHDHAVVIPRDALVLDAIGDTVFIAVDGVAQRREVKLGFREADRVEVVEGLTGGETLIVLGQDGLADGTLITVLSDDPQPQAKPSSQRGEKAEVDEERMQMMRQRMQDRGMSEEEIDQRLERFRSGEGRPPGEGMREGQRGGQREERPKPQRSIGETGGGLPPFMVERIKEGAPEDLKRIRERMRSFGMSDEKIDETIRSIRNEDGT